MGRIKNLFKRQAKSVEHRALSGEVEFVHNGMIKTGRIFGRPIIEPSLFQTKRIYYVRQGDKVEKIEEVAIEELHS